MGRSLLSSLTKMHLVPIVCKHRGYSLCNNSTQQLLDIGFERKTTIAKCHEDEFGCIFNFLDIKSLCVSQGICMGFAERICDGNWYYTGEVSLFALDKLLLKCNKSFEQRFRRFKTLHVDVDEIDSSTSKFIESNDTRLETIKISCDEADSGLQDLVVKSLQAVELEGVEVEMKSLISGYYGNELNEIGQKLNQNMGKFKTIKVVIDQPRQFDAVKRLIDGNQEGMHLTLEFDGVIPNFLQDISNKSSLTIGLKGVISGENWNDFKTAIKNYVDKNQDSSLSIDVDVEVQCDFVFDEEKERDEVGKLMPKFKNNLIKLCFD